jgi:hypothetical protein
VARPLLKLGGKDTYPSHVVTIDGLDKGEGGNDILITLRPSAGARPLKEIRLRVLIISRPEVNFSRPRDGIDRTGMESWSWLARQASSQTAGSNCQWALHFGCNCLSVYPGGKIVRSKEASQGVEASGR